MVSKKERRVRMGPGSWAESFVKGGHCSHSPVTAVLGRRQLFLTLARALEMDGDQVGGEEVGTQG